MHTPEKNRRRFLKQTSLLAGYIATSSATAGLSDQLLSAGTTTSMKQSSIGHWQKDPFGLPTFRYLATPLKRATVDNYQRPAELLEDDPYFILGNYRLTSFVHSSGVVRVMSGERAWSKLNEAKNQKPDNQAILVVTGSTGRSQTELIGPNGIARNPERCERDFGIGYANFSYNIDSVKFRRTLSVAPSSSTNSGLSAYLVEIEFTNDSTEEKHFIYEEKILARYTSSLDRNLTEEQWPVEYIPSIQKNTSQASITCVFSANPKDPSRNTPENQSNRNDLSPHGLCIQSLDKINNDTNTNLYAIDADTKSKYLAIELSTRVPAGKTINAYFLIGTTGNMKPADINSVQSSVDKNKKSHKAISPFINEWKKVIPDFPQEKNEQLRGEMQWNAYVLESMATWSEFYHEAFIPQGMTYDYTMGLTAAPRDHLQHCLPLCYTNPALAKSTIRFVLKKMTYQGEIKYTDIGYGRTSNSAWNTSDQQLYLFMAVADYLRVSGDAAFLEEQTEFLPMEAKYGATTLEKLRRAFGYLRDEISVGPHGLIRLMNSDWNDMIFMDTPIMKHYWTAESHMNSAMGLCVIPALIKELQKNSKKLNRKNQKICDELIIGLTMFEKSNRDAFYKDLESRKFSKRLYLSGGQSLGDKDMHIEPQIFLMQDATFPIEKKKVLWEEIQNRLLNNELLEPRQREHGEPGIQYGPGTGENGGSWHALTGPLVVGLAMFDKPSATALLERMSFKHFAKCYPDYWVGQWTSPDTTNTYESGRLAGLPRDGDNGHWFNFAAYCAHAHAWPLYAYLRLEKNDLSHA